MRQILSSIFEALSDLMGMIVIALFLISITVYGSGLALFALLRGRPHEAVALLRWVGRMIGALLILEATILSRDPVRIRERANAIGALLRP